ncbi:MAG: hypothetical protein AAF196_08080 [Planctomycetota bacterium]
MNPSRFLVFVTAALLVGGASRSVVAQDSPVDDPLPLVAGHKVPKKLASFGSAQIDNWVYVYGGHSGNTHQFGSHTQTGELYRMSLVGIDGISPTHIEELPSDLPVQGTALVAHGSNLFRIGGLRALNGPGEIDDLVSTDTVRRFDTARMRWFDATPLPEPRSSHDAFVLDGRVYVVGGWSMGHAEDGEPVWHKTAWSADLSADELVWEAMPETPFQRRALAIAAVGSRLAVIGGIQEEGGLSSATSIYDPATEAWTDGPDLPARGFGAAATTVNGVLFASGLNSPLFRLEPGADSYTKVVDYLQPRFFERFATLGEDRLVAIAGVGAGDHMSTVEVLPIDGSNQPRITAWTIPYNGEALNRQGVFIYRDALWMFGGNKSTEQHAFEAEDFSREGRALRLATMTVDSTMPEAPLDRQSYVTIQTGKKDVDGWALGGFGHDQVLADGSIQSANADSTERAHADLWHFDLKFRTWTHRAMMPEPRTQFGLCEHEESLYVFGGTGFDEEEEFVYPTSVVRYPLQEDATFETTDFELPRPRRAFGSAKLGDEFFMLGGLGEGFSVIEEIDVFNFETETWRTIDAPSKPRISPRVVELDGRLVMALGISPDGERSFSENRSVEVWEPGSGWRTVIDELPFPARHVRMFAMHGQLVFVSTHFEEGGQAFVAIVDLGLEDLEDEAVGVQEASSTGGHGGGER